MMDDTSENGASGSATGLSPSVQPASGLSGSAASIPDAFTPGPKAALGQHAFLNMLRSLHNIDGYQVPELTWGEQIDFVQNPVKYFIQANDEQQAAIFREVAKRQS